MKRRSFPVWLLRDLPALIGIAWRFWPLMIMVISSGCRAIRGKPIDRSMYEAVMHMLPIAEAKLHDALCRQAWRALGWNVREVRLEILPPITKRVRRRQTLRGLSRPDDGPARSLVAAHLLSSRHLPHPHTHRCERCGCGPWFDGRVAQRRMRRWVSRRASTPAPA